MSVDIPSPTPYIHPSQKPLAEIKESTISKIEISQSDLAELQRVLQSQRMGPMAKQLKQRRIIGECIHCSDIPVYIVTHFYDSVQLIEKYCTKCLEQEKQNGNIR